MPNSTLRRRARQAVLAELLTILSVMSWPAGAQVYQCKDAEGRTTFQQRPCDGAGKRLEVRPANEQVRSVESPSVAIPVPSKPPTSTTKQEPRKQADPLDIYRNTALGLSVGLDMRGVIERWGLPTTTRNDRNWIFMRWCDQRMAALIDGKLDLWDAPFKDSVRGAQLFKYGEPWTAASQRWGADRKVDPYSGPQVGRGETHKWTPLRWVVTDSHGNIVGWCDAAEHRDPKIPPAFNPPWDNALAK